jgi:hypothetical protein
LSARASPPAGPSPASPERYDRLLLKAQNDHQVLSEAQAERIQKILHIQQQNLPDDG